ncbi:hypothetical protein MRX96_025739 [Rhipicephalus microplus]
MSETDQQSTVLKSKGLQMSSLSNSSQTKLEIGNGRLNTIFGIRSNYWVFNRLAFRYGSLVAVSGSHDDARFSSAQLFLKHTCLALCAGIKRQQDFNSMDKDVASAACTLAGSSVSEFHAAFGCSDSNLMAAPKLRKF